MEKFKSFILTLLQWVLTVFCILLVLAFFPGLSAFIWIVAALLFVPIAGVQRFFGKFIPSWSARVVIAFLLSVFGIFLVGLGESDNTAETPETVQTAQETAPDAADTLEKTSEPATPTPEELRTEYISACGTVVYKDVERNPSDYEGKQISVTGEVIQVSEGWLNTVTLRIKNEDGIWYATYVREENEPRILEDDNITAYGECTGVETYSTILGSKTTIPAMKIEYYDLIED